VRAALYRQIGTARGVLQVEEVDRPEPGPGEVRVRVVVSAVNPTDVKARSGAVPRQIDGFQVPHQDGAGVIDGVGRGVSEARIGQRVWLWLAAADRWGTAAEWTVVPQEQAVPLPNGTSFELGAHLGVPAMTAYHCLYADGAINGRYVLVAGGAGAVGHFAIELAVRDGARVATTVSSPAKAELARAAGAHLVVDYTAEGALDQLREFAPRMDRIVEVNIGANIAMDLQLSGPNTTVVCYAASGADPTLPVRACMTANVSLRFVLLYGVPRETLLESTRVITGALHAGELTTLPLHRFPLDDVAAAHEAQESGVTGKVLVDVA
jgi:NADPH2:quinone reductase